MRSPRILVFMTTRQQIGIDQRVHGVRHLAPGEPAGGHDIAVARPFVCLSRDTEQHGNTAGWKLDSQIAQLPLKPKKEPSRFGVIFKTPTHRQQLYFVSGPFGRLAVYGAMWWEIE